MKILLFALLLSAAASLPVLGQTRTAYGPDGRVVYTQMPPSPEITRPRYVNVEPRAVKPTASVTLTIHNGYPDRESRLVRTMSPAMIAAGKSMKGYSTGNSLIDAYIVDSSRRYRIDPLLIYAQMAQESSFKVRALSHKGASGLMQLMPGTARRMGVTDIYDPKQNIEGGVKYMRFLLDLFEGDVNLALAGYNAGEGAVMKYGNQIPPYNETQNYVRIISARYKAITAASRNYARKDQ